MQKNKKLQNKKPVVATLSLAGCWGCHMSLLDIDLRQLEFFDIFELHKSSFTDIKRFTKQCDIGFIEGGCCNDDNVKTLRYFRDKCDLLISVGACAINGGLPALRNEFTLEECLVEAYHHMPTGVKGKTLIPHDEDLPKILDRVYPCHELVKIDYFLPGCPPSADVIWKALTSIARKQGFELPVEMIKYD